MTKTGTMMFALSCSFLAAVCMSVAFPSLGGCSDQTRAKSYGGTATIDLPAGKKLINATWKESSNIWYLVRDMREGETAESYEFKESSSLGIVEGTVKLIEHNKK